MCYYGLATHVYPALRYEYVRKLNIPVRNMAVLSFTLSPEAVGRFYDSLVCLGKFSESVTIEATKDRVRSDASSRLLTFTDLI
jgi:hypothetical protein